MRAQDPFTILEVSLRLGTTAVYLHPGVVTRVTPVHLAQPCCGFPAGTLSGRGSNPHAGKACPGVSDFFRESSDAVLGTITIGSSACSRRGLAVEERPALTGSDLGDNTAWRGCSGS